MSGRLIGVIILVMSAVVLLFIIQQNQYAVPTNIITDITKQAGVTIETYKIPEFLTDEQKQLLSKYATEDFYSDDLPPEYKNLATSQNGDNTVIINGTAFNQTEVLPVYISPEGSGQQYTYGDEILIAGKISLDKKLPPYIYNVIWTCCGMNSYKARSAVETDGQGNFGFYVRPDGSYPLGDWIVTVSVIGDNNQIVKHDFNFRLVAP